MGRDKPCRICGGLPLAAYGLLCNPCQATRWRNWYAALSHEDREAYKRRAAVRSFGRIRPPRRLDGPIALARARERSKRERLANPEKCKARSLLSQAIKSGRLVRPSTCEGCGRDPGPNRAGATQIQGHHHRGYDHPLDVRWLCSYCHYLEHPPVRVWTLERALAGPPAPLMESDEAASGATGKGVPKGPGANSWPKPQQAPSAGPPAPEVPRG